MKYSLYQLLKFVPLSLIVAALVGCGDKLPSDRVPDAKQAERLRAALEAGAAGAEGSAAAALVEPTGWATLTGRFEVVGTPPPLTPLTVNKETQTCKPANSDDVLVDASGGLANVLVFLNTPIPVGDPKWEHEDYLEKKDATLDDRPFDQKNCIFLTRMYPMRSTQTAPILNSDNVGHNANIQPSKGAAPINSGIAAMDKIFYKPGGESPDPFPVACTIHPWMKAYMISHNSPYFAVTKPDGSFTIENIPAAEDGLKLEFRAWQERARYFKEVTVDGAKAKWNNGRFTVELKPGDKKELVVQIDAAVFK